MRGLGNKFHLMRSVVYIYKVHLVLKDMESLRGLRRDIHSFGKIGKLPHVLYE